MPEVIPSEPLRACPAGHDKSGNYWDIDREYLYLGRRCMTCGWRVETERPLREVPPGPVRPSDYAEADAAWSRRADEKRGKSEEMTVDEQVPLFDAIGEIIVASGGNPGNLSIERQKAVVKVIRAVNDIIARRAESGGGGRAAEIEALLARWDQFGAAVYSAFYERKGDTIDIVDLIVATHRALHPAPERKESPENV